jgi:hypothetical protein
MYPGLHALNGLRGMYLGRRAQYGRVHAFHRECFAEFRKRIGYSVLLCGCPGWLELPSDHGYYFGTLDVSQCVEMLDTESPGTGHDDFHILAPASFVNRCSRR